MRERRTDWIRFILNRTSCLQSLSIRCLSTRMKQMKRPTSVNAVPPPTLLLLPLVCLCSLVSGVASFCPGIAHNNQLIPPCAAIHRRPSRTQRPPQSSTRLFGGIGIADTYRWEETQYEIDVTVPVPAGTRAKRIKFRATPNSVHLAIMGWNGDSANDIVLLDGDRPMRGQVSVDGTYWAIADGENDDPDDDRRQITVTIEKMIVEPQDQFEVVEYDWGGVYPNDEEEVSERKYDEPEELDVREYAKSLGVDIDNINMSMVDKTMFSSGLNMTQSTMDELSKAGYVKEVTQQGDGQEFTTGEDGSAMPFNSLGDNIGADEIMNIEAGRLIPSPESKESTDDILAAVTGESGKSKGGKSKIRSELPFIDTHSKWHNSVPVEEVRDEDGMPIDTSMPSGDDDDEVDGAAIDATSTDESNGGNAKPSDPIDLLTVKRLKEILKEQGLKVSGNKQELRDRLRSAVNSKLEGGNL